MGYKAAEDFGDANLLARALEGSTLIGPNNWVGLHGEKAESFLQGVGWAAGAVTLGGLILATNQVVHRFAEQADRSITSVEKCAKALIEECEAWKEEFEWLEKNLSYYSVPAIDPDKAWHVANGNASAEEIEWVEWNQRIEEYRKKFEERHDAAIAKCRGSLKKLLTELRKALKGCERLSKKKRTGRLVRGMHRSSGSALEELTKLVSSGQKYLIEMENRIDGTVSAAPSQ